MKNGYKPRTAILKESDGSLITDKSEIAEKFRWKFETILFKSEQGESIEPHKLAVEQLINEPTTEEIKIAIEMLKNVNHPEKIT